MEKELIELVKSKLPEAEVGAIKKIVEEVEHARKTIKFLEQTNERLEKSFGNLSQEYLELEEDYSKLAEESKKVKAQKEANEAESERLKQDRFDLEKTLLLKDYQNIERSLLFTENLFDKVLKVPRVRTELQKHIVSETGNTYYNNAKGCTEWGKNGERIDEVIDVETKIEE